MDPAPLPPPTPSKFSPAGPFGPPVSSHATVGKDDAFDPSEEYRRLLDVSDPARRLKQNGPGADFSGRLPESYQYLMSRERRVLDTVDRVVNDSIVREDAGRTLFGMPVHELAMKTIGAVRSLMDDLIATRTLQGVADALREPRRMPYLGVAMVAVALLLAAIQCI